MTLNFLKPDWRRIILFLIFIFIMPQLIGGEFVFLGGVHMLKSLFEAQPLKLNLSFLAITFIAYYLLACLIVWIYENKMKKFITDVEEIDVPPPEERSEEEKEELEEG